jgi:cytidylate kinase
VRIVTISAAFGAGGSSVGPAVAERLDVPFLDRAIPMAVARTLAVPVDAALEQDERSPSLIERIITSMAAAGTPLGVSPAPASGVVPTQDSFNAATEQVLRDLVAGGGGVVLGRAGAVVLAGHPQALHVRLDGPRDARIGRVMSYEHIDRDTAAKLTDQTDRAWESYVRYFYKTDPRDPRLYHLVIDATVIPVATCTDVIVTAARGLSAIR